MKLSSIWIFGIMFNSIMVGHWLTVGNRLGSTSLSIVGLIACYLANLIAVEREK